MVSLGKQDTLAEFGEALRIYSRPEDLRRDDNLPVLRISDKTAKQATSFIRAFEFPYSRNEIAQALHELEDGNPVKFENIVTSLRKIGIDLEVRKTDLDNDGGCIVNELIVLHRGNIHDQCGIDCDK